MDTIGQRRRARRIEWPVMPGEAPEYRPCDECSRCVSGTGRDRNPAASDCWDDYLTAATTRRSA